MEDEEQAYYNNITNTLVDTFGNVLSRDVIFTIVESYEGDLEQSANAILNISMDENSGCGHSNTDMSQTPDQNQPYIGNADMNRHGTAQTRDGANLQNVLTQPDISNTNDAIKTTAQSETSTHLQPGTSYASASQNKIQSLHQPAKISTVVQNKEPSFMTNKIKHILDNHEKGICTLIIMRGAPGSGKTYLARKIIDAVYKAKHSQYNIHILSTDDYFVNRGVYHYDKTRLSAAHEWNKNRAKAAMAQGISPVVIDNTNIELWEFECYFAEGVKNGYMIELLEPNTPWAKKANQLCRRNIHNVPAATIRRMLDNFQSGVVGKHLLREFGLQYSPNKKPPVLRAIPPFKPALKEVSIPTTSEDKIASKKSDSYVTRQKKDSIQTTNINKDAAQNSADNNEAITTSPEFVPLPDSQEETNSLEKYEEIRKCLDEMGKIEEEWDNGDNWEEDLQNKPDNRENSNSLGSKPQRRNKFSKHSTGEKLLPAVVPQDWRKCSMLLPSWEVNSNVTTVPLAQSLPEVEKISSSTCIEYGDTDISGSKNPLKVIAAVPRNINEFYIPSNNKKIPEKWTLDKSTSTINNDILTGGGGRCQNEEQHFKAFTKLFKNVAKSDLKDIFDNCCGDVNWAVDIVLDSINSKEIEVIDNSDPSDTEDEQQNTDQCNCLSAYNIIPHHNEPSSPVYENEDKNSVQLPVSSKKGKKEGSVSDAGLRLKKQIEQNVVISEDHYSEHCLKIRKMRRGESDIEKQNETIDFKDPGTSEDSNKRSIESDTPNVSKNPSENCTPSTSRIESNETSDEDDSFADSECDEKYINFELGNEFIVHLDKIFGRQGFIYPSSLKRTVNIPRSTLNEINILWIQSLMEQTDAWDKDRRDLMMEQDEQFARQLLSKEEELSQAGKEPEVPDFKEIMDMDLALSLYQKDVAEWRSKQPLDLAAKMTRDKLHNLFPEVKPDLLSELLVAHDNNFQQTVEVLLLSLGKSDILNEENGVNKYVMKKEIERQEKLMEKEQNKVKKDNWPFVRQKIIDMTLVERYRTEAQKHYEARSANYRKAQEYVRRGMTQAAAYYSDVARFHKKKYETLSHLAASALLQIHVARCSDDAINLHFLRVAEAREVLDMFLDRHIQALREGGGTRRRMLYVITGRGLHSANQPRIKPAAIRRLRERGLTYGYRNPGLLASKVCARHKLSHQLP